MIKIKTKDGREFESAFSVLEVLINGTTHYRVKDNPMTLISILEIESVEIKNEIPVDVPPYESLNEEEDNTEYFVVYDYKDKNYLVMNGANISWTSNIKNCSVFTEDTAHLNITILEGHLGKSFLRIEPFAEE